MTVEERLKNQLGAMMFNIAVLETKLEEANLKLAENEQLKTAKVDKTKKTDGNR